MTRKVILLFLFLLLLLPSYLALADISPALVNTLAGSGEWGSEDGEGEDASFRFPTYATAAHDGGIYVADTKNHLIRKMTDDGKVTTVAGVTKERNENGMPIGGMKDGAATEAMFNEPRGLAVTSDGRIYVADSQNGAIRIVERNGQVSTFVTGLDFPSDIVFDDEGNLYVTETVKHRIVKITPNGSIDVVAGNGYEEKNGFLVGGLKDGAGHVAQFNEPTGLAIGSDKTLYIADTGNQRIRALAPNGNVTTVAGSGTEKIAETGYFVGGYEDGPADKAKFNYPQGLTISKDGTIYVADTLNHRIRKISRDGQVSTVAGNEDEGNRDGVEVKASFDNPMDVIVLPDSNLLIVDHWNHAIRYIQWYELPHDFKKSSQVQIILEDQLLHFDVQPESVSGRIMLPIRMIAEAIGFHVEWDGKTKTVTMTKGEEKFQLQIGNKVVTGVKTIEMDVAPYGKDGRTIVPIRFVAEAFGKDVKWLGKERAVLIRGD